MNKLRSLSLFFAALALVHAIASCAQSASPTVDAGAPQATNSAHAPLLGAYNPLTFAGDLSGNLQTQSVVGLRGNALPAPSGTNTTILWSGSALSWGSPAGVTWANDLSGSSSSQQWIASISGSGGLGGNVTLNTSGLIGSASLSALALGTNKAGATLSLQADAAANVLQLAGGTQNGTALGANVATVGHERTPTGFQWLSRNPANTANNTVFNDDGAGNVNQGSGFNTWTFGANNFNIVAATQIAIEGGTDQYYDSGTHHFRSAAHTEYLSLTAAAGALVQFNATNATSGQVSWTGPAANAGNNITIAGQNAGAGGTGNNNGGDVVANGGTHAGTGFDGAFMLTQAPFGPGYLSTAVSAGTNNLTAAQSDANVIVTTGSPGGAATLNLARSITKQTCVWVRNNATVTVTVGFNGTNSASTLAASTGGYFCADGSALQRIL